jgi:Flp pilus assembly protein TadG
MLRIFHGRERGQVLMLTAALAPMLLGMTGMAIDIGGYAGHKRHLQNAADSIALAAAQDLCKVTCTDTSAAAANANVWASKNNINPSDVTLTFTGGSITPTVRATIQVNHTFAFMRVLGISSKGIGASATAIKASFGGGAGIVPWSITQATIDAVTNGALVTMKYDTTGSNTGNFGAIRIDGPGANIYTNSVTYGSQDVACAISAPNCTTGACPGIYPTTCAENSPTCDGPQCTPQTGNLIGPTRTGVDFRMNNTSAACNTFAGAFSALGGGKYHLNGDCNPWTDGAGKCTGTNPGDLCSRRVIVIPVVDSFGNGASTPTTIQRFALVYLEGYQSGMCQGNNCDIQGRFVQADVRPQVLAGAYDPKALMQFAKLID